MGTVFQIRHVTTKAQLKSVALLLIKWSSSSLLPPSSKQNALNLSSGSGTSETTTSINSQELKSRKILNFGIHQTSQIESNQPKLKSFLQKNS